MIGVVIPAHNECELLGAALAAVWVAARHPALGGEPVGVIVVLDSCTDGSERVAEHHRVARLALDVRNVGVARGRGAELCIEAGARWLAFTDADTVVAPDWLAMQLAENADAVCGCVSVDDWSAHGAEGSPRFQCNK